MRTEPIYVNGEPTHYICTEEGYIINTKTNKTLKTSKQGTVQLTLNGKYHNISVGRTIAKAFLKNPDPEKYVSIINIDGDKTNNNINNIKWITASENSNRVWDIRRAQGNISQKGRNKSENIVEKAEKYAIKDNEKRIYIDNEETPFVISKTGEVRNLRTGNILKGTIVATYPTVNLRWDGKHKSKAKHRLVAEAWIPNPDNLPIVDHINGDRMDCSIENLRWVTYKENSQNTHPDITPHNTKYQKPILSKEELQKEQWKFNSKTEYYVSNMGRVKNKQGIILSGSSLDSGYDSYCLKNSNNKILGHILVWETFMEEKPDNMVINHINGNKKDNRISNLELVTQKDNMLKASIKTDAWNFKKVAEIDEKGNILNIYANASDAARAIGILPGSMRNTIRRNGRCSNGLKYQYIE